MKAKVKNLFSKAKSRPVVVVFTCILVILVLSIASSNDSQNDTNTPGPTITFSTDTPEENLPETIGYTWKGTSLEPKRLIIPTLNVDSYVQKVGVDQNTQIAVPNNIHIAGWFVDSVLPGADGLSIIDGHVNGRNSDEGVFKRLKELKQGDEVIVESGDGTRTTFKVYSGESLPKDSVADKLFSQVPTIRRQLNLITCTGTYDSTSRTYSDRWLTILEAV